MQSGGELNVQILPAEYGDPRGKQDDCADQQNDHSRDRAAVAGDDPVRIKQREEGEVFGIFRVPAQIRQHFENVHQDRDARAEAETALGVRKQT